MRPGLNTSSPAHIPAGAIPELEALYDQGRYVAAHRLAVERHGPLQDWRAGTAACLFGGRLAANLSGARLRLVLVLRARRGVATDLEATPADRASTVLFHAYSTISRRGPLALRRYFKRPGVRADLAGATEETRADILCLEAHVAAAFRDTETAELHWQAACALAPERPWTWCERATLLVAADRYAEALEAAQHSLRLGPWFRPAVQGAAHILTLLGRDEEAVDLLERALNPAVGGVESPAIAGQLADIQIELQRPADALLSLDRFEALSLLQEEAGRQWAAARRSEARLKLGDLAGSADAAEPLAASSFFYARAVERLRDPERQRARRVVLDVPFIRQHDRTCAPATLAALSRFWGRPADHEAITRAICYGGTFDHQERHWAETHGWATREFRADWAGAVALLDDGIPFALATTATNSGHLQAIVGYDARRGTLILRDPYERNQSEALAEEFCAAYAFGGPRAMAIVPADDPAAVARLQAAELPESALHDGLYRLRRALHVHDRPAARTALDALEALDPAARVTLLARRELASYDGDDPTALGTVESLLALFPREGRLRLEKLAVLHRLARPAEARAWLENCAAEPGQTEPNLWRELARELSGDARLRPRARQLLARSLFHEPTEAEHLRLLAALHRDAGDFREAFAIFRLAATSASIREDCWQEFFVTSRYLRETGDALQLLDARFRRLGDRSSQPARTLHWAHRERHEFLPAAAVLEEALRRRPDDGELLLFAATVHGRDGEHEPAARSLVLARGRVLPGAYLRAAAELAGLAGDVPAALRHWRDILAREPLDAAAHQATLRLLAETDPRGPAAAKEHLDAAIARFPHAVALHGMRVTSLVNDPGRGTPEHAAAVAALLAVQPTNVWAHRERALAHQTKGELAAALAALDEAGHLDPLAPQTHAVRGRVLLDAGELEAAGNSLRRALELHADLPEALSWLLRATPPVAGKRAALAFMHGELVRQPLAGDGVLIYRANAYALLEEPELQSQLDAILAVRPDLWQAWSAVVWQHADAGRVEAAHSHARAAAERFPLLPRVWLDLAGIEKLRDDYAAEAAALNRALRIHSAHGEASRRLAEAHRRAGHPAEARTVLEQAIAAAPLDIANRGALAETLWLEDRAAHGAKALELLADAVGREPGYVWAWERLEQYARALGMPDRTEQTLRLLCSNRPGEARSWLRLATSLGGDTGPALDERLQALARALALNPRLDEAYDLRAFLLAGAGRYDEALAACEPPADAYPQGTRPFTLEGRAAWVLARRGDLAGARTRLRAVLADHPGYEWGWRMLADWAEAAKDQHEALAAAERLAFLAPHAALPLGYLAAARLQVGRRTAAKEALREAMRRDPKYLYACATLLQTQMDDREWDSAEETLRFITQQHPGAPALGWAVRLATRRREETRAQSALAELARTQPAGGADAGELQEAVNVMIKAGWRRPVEETLGAGLRDPAAFHPEVGAIWVRSRASQGKWRGLGKAVRLLPEGEFARRARIACLTALGENGRGFRLLDFLRRMRVPLRADTPSWGQAGYALVRCQYHGRVVTWMSDWAARPNVESWMLLNLATAYRKLARHELALEVHRHALTLPPDQTRRKHLAWVALEEALTDSDEARVRATRLHAEGSPRPDDQEQPYRYLNVLTEQVLTVRGLADPAARRAALRPAQRVLRAERRPLGPRMRVSHPAVYRAERRARWRLAREAGAWWPRVAFWLFSPPASTMGLFLFMLAWIAVLVGTVAALATVLASVSASS